MHSKKCWLSFGISSTIYYIINNHNHWPKRLCIDANSTKSPSSGLSKTDCLFFIFAIKFLGEGCSPPFEHFFYLLPNAALWQSCLKVAQWFSKKSLKNAKSLQTCRQMMDKRYQKLPNWIERANNHGYYKKNSCMHHYIPFLLSICICWFKTIVFFCSKYCWMTAVSWFLCS